MRRSHKEFVLLVWQGEQTTTPMQSYAVIHLKQKMQSAVGQLHLRSWPLRNCHWLPSFRRVRGWPPNHRSSKLLWFPSAHEPHQDSVDCEAYIQSSFQRKLAPTNLFGSTKDAWLVQSLHMPTYLRSYMCWHEFTPMFSHKSRHRFRHLFRSIDIYIYIYLFIYSFIYLFVCLFIYYVFVDFILLISNNEEHKKK